MARGAVLVPSSFCGDREEMPSGHNTRSEKVLFVDFVDKETIGFIAAFATIFAAFLLLFRTAKRTIRNWWHKRLRIKIALDPRSNPFLYKFRVTNLSQISVTIDEAVVSLHRNKKKQPMWTNPWSTVEKHWPTTGEEKEMKGFPLSIDPQTNVEVNFDLSKNSMHYDDIRALDQQGHGYLFVKMNNGRIIRHKFIPPPPPEE